MSPPTKPPIHYTPDQETTVRRFEACRKTNGWDQAKAGKMIGCAKGTYSEIINRKYPGDWPRYIQAMARVLARAERRDQAIKDPPYALIAAAEQIEAVCQLCLDQCDMALVQGDSGTGKTVAATAYATVHVADVILVVAHPRFNGLALLRKLADLERLKWEGTSFDVLFDHVALHLANRGQPLLLVDDVDNFTPEALHTVRQLHDQARCPVVLFGTPVFMEQVRRRRNGLDQQALGRIGHVVTLAGIGQDDAEKLTAPFSMGSAARLLAWKLCGGDARLLVKGTKAAILRARAAGQSLDEHFVEQGFESLRTIRLGA